jgi:hypothetical protein
MTAAALEQLEQSIARAAVGGRVHYTEQQLYYELCRTVQPIPGLTTRTALLALAPGLAAALLLLRHPRRALALASANALPLAALRLLRGLPYTRRVPLSGAAFRGLLDDYRARYGEPPGLLTPAPPPTLQPLAGEPDLLDYGLDQVLICEDDSIAQMLIANHAYMDLKCAIVGYSAALPLPGPLRTMLSRTPESRVLLLHNASAAGLELAARLPAALELPAHVRFDSLGLRPLHAMRLHLFAAQNPLHGTPRALWPPALRPGEVRWLRHGWCAEVAAVPPISLLLKLRRIVAGTMPPPRRLFDLRRDREIGFMTWPVA